MMANNHLILYYRGDISALTLFCQQPTGSICFPPLPALSEVVEEDEMTAQDDISVPTLQIKALREKYQLDEDFLVADSDYYQQVSTPQGIVNVYMARFKVLDPPYQELSAHTLELKTITDLMGRPPAEMELLRRAYTCLIEG